MRTKNKILLVTAILFLLLDFTVAQSVWFAKPTHNQTITHFNHGNSTETAIRVKCTINH